eukprot:14515742-Alexandrium_andersonii.AAC.1
MLKSLSTRLRRPTIEPSSTSHRRRTARGRAVAAGRPYARGSVDRTEAIDGSERGGCITDGAEHLPEM